MGNYASGFVQSGHARTSAYDHQSLKHPNRNRRLQTCRKCTFRSPDAPQRRPTANLTIDFKNFDPCVRACAAAAPTNWLIPLCFGAPKKSLENSVAGNVS